MDIFLNLAFAWISVLAALILTIVFFTRKSIVSFPHKRNFFIKLNKTLRKHHKLIGIILITGALIHGLFSTEKVLSINLGTVSWLLSILLGVSWLLRIKLINFKGWMTYHRILVVLFTLSIVIHVIDVGGIQVFNILKTPTNDLSESIADTTLHDSLEEFSESEGKQHRGGRNNPGTSESSSAFISGIPTTPSSNSYADVEFIDGTYTGEALGFRPGLIVSVEVLNNKIKSVDVIDHNEIGSRFYQLPIEQIPIRIVAEQSTDVDIISGATCTSDGIMEAVDNALSKAISD